MKPMTRKVLDHLKRHGRITPMLALRRYGCFRLAARIGELREAGHRIETIIKVDRNSLGDPLRFAEYVYHARRSAA